MEILIVSDSHGRAHKLTEVLERQIRRPDLFIHLGDGARDLSVVEERGIPFYSVRGNCDYSLHGIGFPCPVECLVSVGGRLVFLTHGAEYGVKGGLGRLISASARNGAELVLFGHTHVPFAQTISAGEQIGMQTLTRPMYLFNPESLGEGRFGTLTIQGENVLFAHGNL